MSTRTPFHMETGKGTTSKVMQVPAAAGSAGEVMASRARTFVATALIAGTFDITYAITFSYFRSGVSPERLLQSVAAGAFGRDAAFAGGAATAAAGLGFHYVIAFTITAIFFAAAARLPWLTRRPVLLGRALRRRRLRGDELDRDSAVAHRTAAVSAGERLRLGSAGAHVPDRDADRAGCAARRQKVSAMFERYTESARRVLFFARYESSKVGGLSILPEHLLLGLLRESIPMISGFVSRGSVESLRRTLAETLTPQERVPTSVEIPFSDDAKAVLARAAVEADELKNRWIGPAHLLLGIMVKTSGEASRALHDAGVGARAIRDYLRTAPDSVHDWSAAGGVGIVDESVGDATGAVLRQWKGLVTPGLAGAYLRHLQHETLPALARLTGFVTATVAQRELEDGTEFLV